MSSNNTINSINIGGSAKCSNGSIISNQISSNGRTENYVVTGGTCIAHTGAVYDFSGNNNINIDKNKDVFMFSGFNSPKNNVNIITSNYRNCSDWYMELKSDFDKYCDSYMKNEHNNFINKMAHHENKNIKITCNGKDIEVNMSQLYNLSERFRNEYSQTQTHTEYNPIYLCDAKIFKNFLSDTEIFSVLDKNNEYDILNLPYHGNMYPWINENNYQQVIALSHHLKIRNLHLIYTLNKKIYNILNVYPHTGQEYFELNLEKMLAYKSIFDDFLKIKLFVANNIYFLPDSINNDLIKNKLSKLEKICVIDFSRIDKLDKNNNANFNLIIKQALFYINNIQNINSSDNNTEYHVAAILYIKMIVDLYTL